jgi:hypothetical protein
VICFAKKISILPSNWGLMKKYKVRKMYFICRDKQVISPDVGITNAYQHKNTAATVCKQRQDHYKDTNFAWMKNQPIPVYSVEGFYLVHEDIFKQGWAAFLQEIKPEQ